MKKPFWLVAWLLVIELAVVFVLVPGDWTNRTIEKESRLIEANLGSEARSWIYGKADQWYQSAMMDSGFYEGIYRTMIPNNDQRANSRGMQDMGSWWFRWKCY